MRFTRSLSATCLLLSTLAVPVWAQTPPAPAPLTTVLPMKVFPLPGQLDEQPMLNSNSPEIVQQPGILVSTLPGGPGTPFLDYAFKGDFGVFTHHIAKDEVPGQRLLYLGLLATNQSNEPVKLTLKEGASYLSQPDALFKPLPAFAPNPRGLLYAGPGDRVATELIAGTAPLQQTVIEIPPRSTQIVYSLPVTTDVAILPPINGRSTLMHFNSDKPVYLSHLAYFAAKQGQAFKPPTLEDYRQLLDARTLAGPREQAPPEYNPGDPPLQTGYRYGRVSGVSQGVHWRGRFYDKTTILQRPQVGETAAYPLSAVYLKRWGTAQNQSGDMLRRYPDTAYQSHGNYGVRYELDIPLDNVTPQFQTYALGLSQPSAMEGTPKQASMTYLNPPTKAVMFRGSARLRWQDEYKQSQDRLVHLVLRNGEQTAPIEMVTVPPRTRYDLRLSLIYPADCTPPQLLTLKRVE
ncbi:MAG: DUF3370 domain-containing protein [Candidatus Sericytochromatia bacterium]